MTAQRYSSPHGGPPARVWCRAPLLTALLFALAAEMTPSSGQAPGNQIADPGAIWAREGSHISHIEDAGTPAVCYYNASNGDLIFAFNFVADGTSTWVQETVASVGDVGMYCSLALIDFTPCVSYYDQTNGNLVFARKAGGGVWTRSVVNTTGDVGLYTSLAEVDGKPAISYYDATTGNLKYARNSASDGSGTWTFVTVDNSADDVGKYTSLAVVDGKPAISYYDDTNSDLKYARNSAADGSGTWTLSTVDSADAVGSDTSLAVVGGRPAISYYDGTNTQLKYARNFAADGSGAWEFSIVDNAGSVGRESSLKVVNGMAAISYWDFDNGTLKYARSAFFNPIDSWGTPVTVDSTASVGRHSSLAVIAGNPAIFYQDYDKEDVKYARSSDANGNLFATWTPRTVPKSTALSRAGQYSSQVIVAGNPAIAYHDADAGDLKFMRATNTSGTAWGAPVTVDTTTDHVGNYCSMAIVDGMPAISYHDVSNGDLRFVINTVADGSGTWKISVVDTTGTVGQYTSLEVVNGMPAISYYDFTNGDLKFARASSADGGGPWTLSTVDSGSVVGRYTSLAVVGGTPAISYHDDINTALKFARNSAADGSGTWTLTTVDNTSSVGRDTSLLVMADGKPAISYYDFTNSALKFARNSNTTGTGTWTLATVDNTSSVGQDTSLALLNNGLPAISYRENTNSALKFARNSAVDGSGAWTLITADSIGDAGEFTSLAVVNGTPAISHYDSTLGILRYARNSAVDGGGTWSSLLLDNGVENAGDVGQHSSMLSFGFGTPRICYYDVTNGNLKYAFANSADGTGAWTQVTVDSTGMVGQYASMVALVNVPGISYYDNTNGDLKFARSTFPKGDGPWTPVTVDSTGNVGQYISAAVIDDAPGISYYDITNGDLKFARNSTASGLGAWTVTTVDSGGTVGQHTSLAVISNAPAISYYDVTNSALKYARNSAADGSGTWTMTTVDNAAAVGLYTSLVEVNGRPAISYYDSTNGNLKYARNSAADGSGAWTVTTVDSTGTVGLHTSLAVVGGTPGISYYDQTNTNLKFARNSAADGSGTWTVMTLDNTDGRAGEYTSLHMVSGYAAISYYDEGRGDLKYTVVPAPEIVVEQPENVGVADGSTKSLGTAVLGGNSSLSFSVINTGSANLTGLTHTINGTHAADFSVTTVPTSPVAPAGTASCVIRFTPSAAGTRTAAIHFANNDLDENPFDINLTATGLSFTIDTDGDGLNDASEFQMAALGFDHAVNQAALVDTYYASANGAGLFTPTQVQALHISAPLIQKNPTTGVFTLTIGVEKSLTLAPLSFQPFSMLTAPGASTSINGAGKLQFQFTVPDNTAFFQLRAE